VLFGQNITLEKGYQKEKDHFTVSVCPFRMKLLQYIEHLNKIILSSIIFLNNATIAYNVFFNNGCEKNHTV
jgi:hypothetical protein